jgi:hypothetical protein
MADLIKLQENLLGYLNVDFGTSKGKTFDVNQLLMVMVSLNSVEGTRSVAQEYRLIMFDN